MLMRVFIASLVTAAWLASFSRTHAGIYSTMDAEVETDTRSPNFHVFQKTLLEWQSIPAPDGANPPLKRRYLLLEKLGAANAAKLTKPGELLNYSAVLIRRGRADEAAQLLLQASREHPENFVILSQLATAHFLGSPELRANSLDYMREAFSQWPVRWDDLKPEQKAFVASIGWEQTAFDRNRRYDKAFERLMRSRINEEKRLKKKETLKDTVDPIFGDPKNPVRFVNEKGEFTVGQIPTAEFKQLPPDADVLVQQLLIWMPNDERLLWLLGEVLNARAMQFKDAKEKHSAIRNAGLVFQRLNDVSFNRSGMYGQKEFKHRYDVLNEHIKQLPPEEMFDPRKDEVDQFIAKPDDAEKSLLENMVFWRTLIVGLITGFVIGVFALWQLQEMRRRRLVHHR
jgi:hypothetical protein